MAKNTDTSMYADGHQYSLFDAEEIHRDMRQDPEQAQVVLKRNAAIAAAHEDCEQCRGILEAHKAATAGTAPAAYANIDESIVAHSERCTQFVISRANLARMLGLGPGEKISRLHVDESRQQLHAVITGEHYQPVLDGEQVPISRTSKQPYHANFPGKAPE
jgi:hypothetical protein